MAVIIKYIVERNGVEKKTFTSKKEADAYDKLLDTAEELGDWLGGLDVELSEVQCEELGYQLAIHKDTLQRLLKGQPPKPPGKAGKQGGPAEDDADTAAVTAAAKSAA